MITFEAGGRTYQWGGGFGAIIQSHERGREIGDVRMIGGELFYVFMVANRTFLNLGKSLVSWTQPNPTIEHIRELRQRFLGGQA